MTPVLDLPRVRRFLHERNQPGTQLEELDVTYVKLRRDGPVLALLETPSNDGPPTIITARWTDAATGRKLATDLNEQGATHGRSTLAGAVDHPASYAEDLGLLFVAFPFDRRLRSLPLVTHGAYMASRLTFALTTVTGGATITAIDIRVVRYKPEGKCVLEYRLNWSGGHGVRPEVLYGKVAKRSIAERSRAVRAHIQGIGRSTSFSVPVPLAVIDDLSLELWSRLPGASLCEVIGTDGHPGLGAATGRALRSLHDLPVVLPAERTAQEKAALVTDNACQIARYLPVESVEARRLGQEIARRLDETSPVDARPTHHDFHGQNVLVDGRSVGLLDFEDLAMGDGADDVGSMYGHLTELAVRKPQQAARIEAELAAFIDAYDVASLGDRFTTYAAMHCLLAGYQTLRYPGLGSDRHATDMLRACERLLQGRNE